MAEIEFHILDRDYFDRRIPNKSALINEVNAWTGERKSKKSKLVWHSENEDVSIKLKLLCTLLKSYQIKIEDVLVIHLYSLV